VTDLANDLVEARDPLSRSEKWQRSCGFTAKLLRLQEAQRAIMTRGGAVRRKVSPREIYGSKVDARKALSLFYLAEDSLLRVRLGKRPRPSAESSTQASDPLPSSSTSESDPASHCSS